MRVEVPDFRYELNRTSSDYGLTAFHQILCWKSEEFIPYLKVKRKWGWYGGVLFDLPYHHSKIWKKYGYKTHWFRATPELVQEWIRKREPVVVLIRTGFLQYRWNIITGYDWEGRWILSTGRGHEVMSQDEMEDFLFDPHWDTYPFGFQCLAYVVLKDKKKGGLSWPWKLFQCGLGVGAWLLRGIKRLIRDDSS